MRFVSLFLVAGGLSLLGGLFGCGNDTGGGDTGTGRDAEVSCMSGTHACGSVCEDDQVNEPDIGCRNGCGSACPDPGAGGMATCTSSGNCSVRCEPPAVERGGRCECAPQSCTAAGAMCGSGVPDGCGGTLECGECGGGRSCGTDFQCSCTVDAAEMNDEELDAFYFGEFSTEPDTTMMFSEYTLHSADDVDIYRVRVLDSSGDSPTILVTISDVPPGSDYEVGAWYRCDNGGDTTRCDVGVPAEDTTLGPVGCVSEREGSMTTNERVLMQTFCDTTDESGNLLIQVRSTTWMNACMPYQLNVTIE